MLTLDYNLPKPVIDAITKGLEAFKRPEPLSLSEWADRYFYLSAESSYTEGRWKTYPYQKAILDCIGHADIKEITVMKSARIGFTKMLLAAIGYYAEHKKRSQCLWQPTDSDISEFVKTEVDTMIRDVPVIRRMAPWAEARKHKNNAMRQKVFPGSVLYIRGGKAARNYRRISIDVAYMDELDAFDLDIEGEGSPDVLAMKRLAGSSFPKFVCGSTPKHKETSLIYKRLLSSELIFRFHIPCPHCNMYQDLRFGDKTSTYGLRWADNDPDTVMYQCMYCKGFFSQEQYLEVWHQGKWMTETGVYIDDDLRFFTPDKEEIPPPNSIGFHIWTIYSPQESWSGIVREFLRTKNDPIRLKTFINTTLGEPWEDYYIKLDNHELLNRRENYSINNLPRKIELLTAGVDVQDNRIEVEVIGWYQENRETDPECWGVEYKVLYGDPGRQDLWKELDQYLLSEWHTEDNRFLRISSACIDAGGHFTSTVLEFCHQRKGRNVFAIRGVGGPRPIWTPKFTKSQKHRYYFWYVGVDTAKELWYSRLSITEPGPGYCHFPYYYPDEFFDGLLSEKPKVKIVRGKPVREWVLGFGKRNEPLDIRVYALAAYYAKPIVTSAPKDEPRFKIQRRVSTWW